MLVGLLLVAGCGGAAPGTSPPVVATTPAPVPAAPGGAATPAAPRPPHVLVIVLENREYNRVIDRATDPGGGGDGSDWPRLNALARGGALAVDAYGTTHPSEPNYLELLTGGTQGVHDDALHVVDAPSLPAQLDAAGVGWRAYMGGMPVACDPDTTSGRYAVKHNPFLLLRGVRDSPRCPEHVVPGSRLGADLTSESAPPFLWYSPDLCADGHDHCIGSDLADAQTAATVQAVRATAWYRAGGVIVVTWDEGTTDARCCGGRAAGGHVPVIVLSDSLRPGTRLQSTLDQAGILRGLEELYGVPPLGEAADPTAGNLLPLLRPGS